jgi:hypothetical protein
MEDMEKHLGKKGWFVFLGNWVNAIHETEDESLQMRYQEIEKRLLKEIKGCIKKEDGQLITERFSGGETWITFIQAHRIIHPSRLGKTPEEFGVYIIPGVICLKCGKLNRMENNPDCNCEEPLGMDEYFDHDEDDEE